MTLFEAKDLRKFYGDLEAVHGANLSLEARVVPAEPASHVLVLPGYSADAFCSALVPTRRRLLS